MDERSSANQQPAATEEIAASRELRRGYHDRIAELRDRSLAVIGGAVAGVTALRTSLAARPADPGPPPAGPDGIRGDGERMQALAAVVDSEVVDLLALESPVARDLRVILASRDVTQLALLCVGLCSALQDRLQPASAALNQDLYELLSRVVVGTEQLLRQAEAAWAVLDVELAMEVSERVVAVRILQTDFIAALIGLEGVAMDAALALAMVARAFERLADHAVEIAERVQFAVHGTPAPLITP